eukprot:scaffold17345_cov39-Cyclotella_meneghiniana.AAC.1
MALLLAFFACDYWMCVERTWFVILNGVMVVRGMANHKLSRLHYVRATAEEAKFTAEANHSITDGKLGNRGVAAGIPAIHQRDMQLMNNSVMETTSAHFRRVLQDLFELERMISNYI